MTWVWPELAYNMWEWRVVAGHGHDGQPRWPARGAVRHRPTDSLGLQVALTAAKNSAVYSADTTAATGAPAR
jgi:hypothetical protein